MMNPAALKKEIDYLSSTEIESSLRIRTLNNYLKKKNSRLCSDCFVVYKNIKENFHIKKYITNKYGKKIATYSSQCRKCRSIYTRQNKQRLLGSIETYSPRLVVCIRNRAKGAMLPFNLDANYLVDLWNSQEGNCYYTGLPMDLSAKTANSLSPHHNFPSIDKMIPELGYVKGNVVWTLWSINRMKNDLTSDRFLDLCNIISKRISFL